MIYLLPKASTKASELEQLAKKAGVNYVEGKTLRDVVITSTDPGITILSLPDRTFELLTRVVSELMPEGEVIPVIPDAPEHSPSMVFQGLMDQFPKMYYDTLEQQLLKTGLLATNPRQVEDRSLAVRQGKPPLADSDLNLDRLDVEKSFIPKTDGVDDDESLS